MIFTKWVKNNGMKEQRNQAPLTQGKGEHVSFFPDCSGPMGPAGCTQSLPLPKSSQGVPPTLKHSQSPPPPLSSAGSFIISPGPPQPHLTSHHSNSTPQIVTLLILGSLPAMPFFTLRNPVYPSILSLRIAPMVCRVLKCAPLIFQWHPNLGVDIRNFAEVVQVPNQ